MTDVDRDQGRRDCRLLRDWAKSRPRTKSIDASGPAVLPGVIDMHSHHRQGSRSRDSSIRKRSTLDPAMRRRRHDHQHCDAERQPPPNTCRAARRSNLRSTSADAIVDWNFNPRTNHAEEIPFLAEARHRRASRSSWWPTPAAAIRTCRASACTTTASYSRSCRLCKSQRAADGASA